MYKKKEGSAIKRMDGNLMEAQKGSTSVFGSLLVACAWVAVL